MRRKYVLVCISLLTASGAAAFATLPQNGGVRRGNLPFVPEVFALLGAGEDKPADTVTPTAETTPRPRRDPFSPIDLPLGTGRIFLAEAGNTGTGGPEQPAGQQEAQAQAQPNNTETTDDAEDTEKNENNDSGFDIADGGFSTIAIPTSLRPLRVPNIPPPGGPHNLIGGPSPNSLKPPETQTVQNPNGPGGDDDGDGDGDGGRTVQVDEPGPLSLLLLGGLALALTRRAKRLATA
jgi:hypothetical protein